MSVDEAVIRQAVVNALESCGDGSYITSFDTEATADIVVDRVTEYVMRALGEHDTFYDDVLPRQHAPVRFRGLAVLEKAEPLTEDEWRGFAEGAGFEP